MILIPPSISSKEMYKKFREFLQLKHTIKFTQAFNKTISDFAVAAVNAIVNSCCYYSDYGEFPSYSQIQYDILIKKHTFLATNIQISYVCFYT